MTTDLGNVLVIVENHDDRQTLAEGLRHLGWIVEVAANGQLGLDAAMKKQPEIVITDLAASGVQGLSYARALRTCIEHDAVIIGIAPDLGAVATQALAAGFDKVVAKPANAGIIDELLRSEKRRSSQNLDSRATTKMQRIK